MARDLALFKSKSFIYSRHTHRLTGVARSFAQSLQNIFSLLIFHYYQYV